MATAVPRWQTAGVSLVRRAAEGKEGILARQTLGTGAVLTRIVPDGCALAHNSAKG